MAKKSKAKPKSLKDKFNEAYVEMKAKRMKEKGQAACDCGDPNCKGCDCGK
jgi:hypothetical protein